MKYFLFTNSDGATNEAAFNDMHARIMQLKGLPSADGLTKDWAQPIAHPTQDYIAMPVDETCYPALTQAEQIALVPNLPSDWVLSPTQAVPAPWWGFLVFWK